MAKEKENPVKLEIEIVRVKNWNPAQLLKIMRMTEESKKAQKPA